MLAIRWPDPDPRLEAAAAVPVARRIGRAHRAAVDVVRDFHRLELETVRAIVAQLAELRRELLARLSAGLVAQTSVAAADALARDAGALIAAATRQLAQLARRPYATAVALGHQAAEDPIRALQVDLPPRLLEARGARPVTIRQPATFRGVDDILIRHAEDNTTDLLSPPMQAFAGDVRAAIRRVTTAGAGRMEEIQRLQRKIADDGIPNAAYGAERIIRTEAGRVFGASTFARLEDMARTFAFLKKAWKATADSRTRLGHREAGATYGRGNGIPIAEKFAIPVYDERGKLPKRLGVVELRYPIDPQATPAGRLAASATILCRCHAVVDVDPTRFADFARAQVQFALGSPAPLPVPAPLPAPPPGPPKIRKARTARAKAPAPAPASRATGTPVSAALDVAKATRYRPITDAIAMIDRVHGDGRLPRISVGAAEPGIATDANAYYRLRRPLGRRSLPDRHIGMRPGGLDSTPYMTTTHEVGHFLDDMGLGEGGGRFGSIESLAHRLDASRAPSQLRGLMEAINNSAAIGKLRQWRHALGGWPGALPAPPGVRGDFLDYMLDPSEMFARAYAQYVTIRSGHAPALAELRGYQAASAPTMAGLPPGAPRSSSRLHQPAEPGSWQYPWQWQDDDFAGIASEFDRLFEALKWRSASPRS